MADLATAMAPHAKHEIIGIRPGEKLHEVMISEDDARSTIDIGDRYIILPAHAQWRRESGWKGDSVPEGFRYASDSNDDWLDEKRLKLMLAATPES